MYRRATLGVASGQLEPMSRSHAKQSMPRLPAGTSRPSKGERRESLLRSATAVLADRGYPDCTVREITQAAGITRTSFYSLFRSKNDILNTILAETSSQTISKMQAAHASAEEWPDKVCAGLRAMLDFFASDPELARVAFVEAQIAGPQAVSLVQGAMRQYTTNLAAAFPTRDGGLKPPPPTTSEQIAGAIYFTMYDAVAQGNTNHLVDLLPLIAEIALSPYLPAETVQGVVRRHQPGNS